MTLKRLPSLKDRGLRREKVEPKTEKKEKLTKGDGKEPKPLEQKKSKKSKSKKHDK